LDPNIQGMQKTYRGVGRNDAKKTTKKSKKGLNSIPIVNKSLNNKLTKKKKLFFEEALFFRVVFAFVDAELALGFDAAAFACVLAPQKRRELEEGAFGTECAHFLRSYRVIILLKTGNAMAIMITPNAMRTMRSVDI
jgi:hypothetical protein